MPCIKRRTNIVQNDKDKEEKDLVTPSNLVLTLFHKNIVKIYKNSSIIQSHDITLDHSTGSQASPSLWEGIFRPVQYNIN